MKKLFFIIFLIATILLVQVTLATSNPKVKRVIAHNAKAEDRALFESQGCVIIHKLINLTAMSCPEEIAKNYEPDKIYHVLDTESNEQINVDDVWNLGYTGEGVTIAVLDTGIDTDHPELSTSIVGGRCFVTSPTPCSPDDYEDYDGHGTRVAGVITADGNDANAKSVSPDAKIWVGRVCDRSCFSSDIAAGIEYVVLNDISKIISISVGGAGTSEANCDGEVVPDKANWAVDQGVTVIAAAGRWNNSVAEPACASKVIAVGAVSKTDERWIKSGTGLALDMMGPGVDIYTTQLGGGYSSGTGTSMGAPHVSAVIALLRQINPGLTDSQIKDALYQTAVDLGESGWDVYHGWGRIDALGAANYVMSQSMRVASIDMALSIRPKITSAKATVTITDLNNIPVKKARVYGYWGGVTTDMDSKTTNGKGQVTLRSDRVKDAASGIVFTFCVDNVVKSSWIYYPGANVINCNSITV